MKFSLRLFFAVGLVASVAMVPARAEQAGVPLPTDSRLIQFIFDADNTYTILTRPGDITNVQLGQDERVQNMAIGDSLRWVVRRAGTHIFIKPTESNLQTSATIVTDRRIYQLTLRSGPLDGRWYQRVSWTDPEVFVIREDVRPQPALAATSSPLPIQAPQAGMSPGRTSKGGLTVNVDKLNFKYDITGDASFKPVQAFDDGTFTWIKMPDDVQSLPAVFVVGEKGAKAHVPNYDYKDNYLIIHRRSYQTVLRIGDKEVRVTQKTGMWD
jgi:type IV secretion system protein VirB9